MIDIKLFRKNESEICAALKKRGDQYLPLLQQLKDADRRALAGQKELERLRARLNDISKKFGRAKAEGGGAPAELKNEADRIKAAIRDGERSRNEQGDSAPDILLRLPNLPDPSIPVGSDEKANKEVRRSGEPKGLGFEAKDHQTIGERLGVLDLESASAMSGSRFTVLTGKGARLERALAQWMLDVHTNEHGYTEVSPPLLVNAATLTGTGQLPKFEEDQYQTAPDGLYLIPTAEVPLTNLHRGAILKEAELPIQYAALTPCFRREAGSYGKDTRGMIRVHQFYKVELVWICRPEESYDILENLTGHAETILSRLGLSYRVLELCTGDMGFSAAKTYDLEMWMPGEKRWREVSSCSNCTDFQARRMKTRFKRDKGKPELVHTLNGSGVAVGRVLAAIFENYQLADGAVVVPEVLRPYVGFDKIEPA